MLGIGRAEYAAYVRALRSLLKVAPLVSPLLSGPRVVSCRVVSCRACCHSSILWLQFARLYSYEYVHVSLRVEMSTYSYYTRIACARRYAMLVSSSRRARLHHSVTVASITVSCRISLMRTSRPPLNSRGAHICTDLWQVFVPQVTQSKFMIRMD